MSDYYYDFNEVLERVPQRISAICKELYPEGCKKGHNWCVSDEIGGKGQSFQISMDPSSAGAFVDRSDPSIRGNIIALIARKQNCDYKEAGAWLAQFLGVKPKERIFRKQRKQPKIAPDAYRALTMDSIAFAKSRGIEVKALHDALVLSADHAIVFPHYDSEGNIVLLKYWSTDGNKKIWTNPDPIHCLFGKNMINPVTSGGELIITEGQWDALTWQQCGFPAVSIPSGCSNDEWIEEDWSFLSQFTTIYLDFDNDYQGYDAEQRVKARLGIERCRCLRYDFKDANEALVCGNSNALREALEQARNAPVEHIVDPVVVRHQVQEELTDLQAHKGVPFFMSDCRDIQFRPHEATLWYGYTGHGKSTAIMQQFAFQAGLGINGLIASFEDNTAINYATLLRQYAADPDIGRREYFEEAYNELTDRIKLFDSMRRTQPEVVVATMTLAHKQLGICHFAVDNVMTLDVDRQDNTAQAKVADAFRVFVAKYPVHLHIAAHPRKPPGDGPRRPPELSDVRGAAEWADMVQNAVCVWRDMLKAEKISQMFDDNVDVNQIMQFRMSSRDGKFLGKKQRRTGKVPISSFYFDEATKRFYRYQSEKESYFTREKTDKQEPEYSPEDDDQPNPFEFMPAVRPRVVSKTERENGALLAMAEEAQKMFAAKSMKEVHEVDEDDDLPF